MNEPPAPHPSATQAHPCLLQHGKPWIGISGSQKRGTSPSGTVLKALGLPDFKKNHIRVHGILTFMEYRAQGAQVAQSSSPDATGAGPGPGGGPAAPTWAAGDGKAPSRRSRCGGDGNGRWGSWDSLLTSGKCGSSPHRERYLCAGDGGC